MSGASDYFSDEDMYPNPHIFTRQDVDTIDDVIEHKFEGSGDDDSQECTSLPVPVTEDASKEIMDLVEHHNAEVDNGQQLIFTSSISCEEETDNAPVESADQLHRFDCSDAQISEQLKAAGQTSSQVQIQSEAIAGAFTADQLGRVVKQKLQHESNAQFVNGSQVTSSDKHSSEPAAFLVGHGNSTPGIQSEVSREDLLDVPQGGSPGYQEQTSIHKVVYGDLVDLKNLAWRMQSPQSYMMQSGVILHEMKGHIIIKKGDYKKGDDFVRLKRKGRGAQGECWLVRDKSSGFEFCIKTVTSEYRPEEIIILADLNNVASIVQIYGALRIDNGVHIFMEYLDGFTLYNWISKRNRGLCLSCDEVRLMLKLFLQLLGALELLQRELILHEDLKAQNIMVTGPKHDPRCKLIDFGLSRFPPVEAGSFAPGTVRYFSPEKARSAGHDFKAEVYAITTTLAFMLVGEIPFEDISNEMKVLMTIGMKGSPKNWLPNWIPTWLKRIIESGWEDEPEKRASAKDLSETVRQSMGEQELWEELSRLSLHESSVSDESSDDDIGINEMDHTSDDDEYDDDDDANDDDADDENDGE